jgi:hypothetical protein
MAVLLGAAVPPRPRTLGPLLQLVVVLTVAMEVVWTSVVVMQAYEVF